MVFPQAAKPFIIVHCVRFPVSCLPYARRCLGDSLTIDPFTTATILNGPPLPPAIFIGNATNVKPIEGSWFASLSL
jgi:hypothetical protein